LFFENTDKLFEIQPFQTPYHYCGNDPVNFVDPSGMLGYTPANNQEVSNISRQKIENQVDNGEDNLNKGFVWCIPWLLEAANGNKDKEAEIKYTFGIDLVPQLPIARDATVPNSGSSIVEKPGGGPRLGGIKGETNVNNKAKNIVEINQELAIDITINKGIELVTKYPLLIPFLVDAIPAIVIIGIITCPGDQAIKPANVVNSEGNTNPYTGPVDGDVFIVDPAGNVIPIEAGEMIEGSPDGVYQQVKDKHGNPTGSRKDGGHKPGPKHPKPSGWVPHAHRPGYTNPDGDPQLPINQGVLISNEMPNKIITGSIKMR
jgi:hypothetical protein